LRNWPENAGDDVLDTGRRRDDHEGESHDEMELRERMNEEQRNPDRKPEIG